MDPIFEDDSMDGVDHNEDAADESTAQSLAPEAQPNIKECLIDGQLVNLPSQLCEDASVLSEMLSCDLLEEVLSTEQKQQLQSLMPAFELDIEAEHQKTWRMLFSKENFSFGNPVEKFCRDLETGAYNPDTIHIRKLYKKLQRKHVKQEQRSYYLGLLQNVVVSRQQLIENAVQLPPGNRMIYSSSFKSVTPCSFRPGQSVRIPTSSGLKKPSNSKSCVLATEERVRKRYFDELRALDCYSSDDDIYPEGPPAPISKKQRRHLCTVQGSMSCDIRPVQSTLTQEIYNRLIVIDKPDKPIDEDVNKVKGCAANGDIAKPQETLSSRKPTDVKRDDWRPVVDILSRVSASKNPYDINEETFKLMMARHRTLRKEGRLTVEFDVGETKVEDVGERVRLCTLNKKLPTTKVFEMPKKKVVLLFFLV